MPLETPIYDRTQADINARNSKAFFNVTDWNRIYTNAETLQEFIVEKLNVIVAIPTVPPPLETYFPEVEDFNTLLLFIENMRSTAISSAPGLFVGITLEPIFHEWESGYDKESPKYTHVNQWERTLDIVYNTINVNFTRLRFARTGIAIANAGLNRNNRFRS